MKGAVVDASVALKWVLNDEECVPEALALRDQYLQDPRGFPLLAPSLWRYEVANGLYVATRRGRLSENDAREALASLLEVGVRWVEPDAGHLLNLALSCGIAVYDAAYLAVAERHGLVLWTADRPFYDAVREQRSDVQWIGTFQQ